MKVEVTHRFRASAERVYDAFFDPEKAAKFLFSTPSGRVVRCEIDARVGGRFTIVDRRGKEDVEHVGRYVELDRPRRIVFAFSVPKYSNDEDVVTVDIEARDSGCELTLTHEVDAAFATRTKDGWSRMIEVLDEVVPEEATTCGIGIAQHAAVISKIATMFEGLAETLELHRTMLTAKDESTKNEDEVYATLASEWRDIAKRVLTAAKHMREQRDLKMGAHDESTWGARHEDAFAKFVDAQSRLTALLRVASQRDEAMLASMRSGK
ncbi:MAG: SRPBCC family protein [Archangium sp.]